MKIKGIIGSNYLCSNFVNHDGTIVSDHPLYVFDTDEPNTWVAVMFTQKSNPFTAKNSGRVEYRFEAGSTRDAMATLKTFQAEVYIVNKEDKEIKYSEYQFKNNQHNINLCKTLRRAVKEGLDTNFQYGIVSYHPYNSTDNVENQEEVAKSLFEYLDGMMSNIAKAKFPAKGYINSKYEFINKLDNSNGYQEHNDKVRKERKYH